MTSVRVLRLLACLSLLAPPAAAQDLASGPEPGKKVARLNVFDATGPHKDEELDYAAERKGKPTVYVFVRADAWDRPMARFLRKLDEALPQVGEDCYVIAVWLTDDPDKAKQYLPVAQRSLEFQTTALTCFTGRKAGPREWGVNPDARLTAVVAHKGRVVKRFGYRSINETDVPAVRDALKKALARK
jgi:hypothetical protein